jgi:hypothetical protein
MTQRYRAESSQRQAQETESLSFEWANNLIVSVSDGPKSDSNAQALNNRQGVSMTKIKTLTAAAIFPPPLRPRGSKDKAHHERPFRGAYSWMTNSSVAVATSRAEYPKLWIQRKGPLIPRRMESLPQPLDRSLSKGQK